VNETNHPKREVLPYHFLGIVASYANEWLHEPALRGSHVSVHIVKHSAHTLSNILHLGQAVNNQTKRPPLDIAVTLK